MNIRYLSLALFVLVIGCSNTLPQKSSRKSAVKRILVTKPAAVKPAVKRVPDYQINLKITDGPKYFVSIVSPEHGGHIQAAALGSLITDLPTGADAFNQPNNVFPKVVVEVGPNVTMLDLWNPITLFRRGRTEISVAIPTGMPSGAEVFLTVPWDLPEPKREVKPNPLWLVVTLAADGRLSLNNEAAGTLTNTAPLTKQLQEIFRAREVNGVLREGVNEIEKSVTIVMPMSDRKFTDLVTIARAVWLPGGDRIALAMEDPFADFVVERDDLVIEGDDLLSLPPIPPGKKP